MKRYRYQNPFQSGDNHKTMAKGDLKKIKSYSQELLHKKCQYLPKNFYKSDPPPSKWCCGSKRVRLKEEIYF